MRFTILKQNVDEGNFTYIPKMQVIAAESRLRISMEKSGRNCYHLSQILFLPISLLVINKKQLQRLLKELLVYSQYCFRGKGNEMSSYPIEEEIW